VSTARVTGSTRVSMALTVPVKVSVGYARLRAETVRPGRRLPSAASGTRKSSLTVRISSSVVIAVPFDTRAPGLTRRRPVCPAKGAVTTRS